MNPVDTTLLVAQARRILSRYSTRPANERLYHDLESLLEAIEGVLDENERLRDIIASQEIRLRGMARGA